MTRISRFTALAIALSMFVGPAACMRRARVESQQAATGTPDYYTPAPATVLFAQAAQPELVRAGVVRALADRGYNAESEQPGQIIARYTRGRVDLRVQIQYQASQATITYLGSQGLRIDAAGRARYYDRWVQQLSSSIQNHVAVASRRQVYVVQQPVYQAPPQVYYVEPQPVQAQPQQQVIVAAPPPPTVVVQQPQPAGTLVMEGNIGGVQGTVYVTP